MTTRLTAPLAASALAWALFTGCSSPDAEVEPVETTGAGPEMPGDVFAAEDAALAQVELDDEQRELINQLPPEDAELALAQTVCPVSEEPLGSMGVPIKVDADGTPVFVCCAGCKGEVEADPAAFLAKLPQGEPAAAEAPAPEGEGS
ncbi:hypothetical protein [Tautonia plasticadhaerens]|uniref:Secreted protein n=1 Tax=Tautonia plasticadhaerens TaxID=2527974 RepID=A0A518H0Z6_9BACT|nr:hypothetical protein [Tautonia plasticadhaerens]QDV34488.1 hypothetical protein ElP_23770 [Tautonia plasticadhaerens]